jgi:hypothetical protein
MSAAMTWLVVVPIWLAASIVVGVFGGRVIRLGEEMEEK